jgi:hypothetical protein
MQQSRSRDRSTRALKGSRSNRSTRARMGVQLMRMALERVRRIAFWFTTYIRMEAI